MTTIPTTPTMPPLPRRAMRRSLLVLLAGLAALAASAVPAAAATRTWSGGAGPVNNQWTIASNWQGAVAPVAGDDLIFPTGVAQSVTLNNFPAGTSFGSITFNASYTATGNAIAMTGTFTVTSAGAPTVTFGLPIAIASAPNLTVNVGDTAILALGGPLSGAAGLIKAGTGTLRMVGTSSNAYTGLTTVDAGTIVLARVSPAFSIPAGLTVGNVNGGASADVVRLETSEQIAGPITVTSSGWLDLANRNQTVTTTLTMRGGLITTGAGVLTLNADISVPLGLTNIEGQLSLGGATRTIDVTSASIPGLDIKAIVVEGGASAGLIKTGTGRVRLSGANTFTGITTIQTGTIMAANPQALGSAAAGTAIGTLGTLLVESNIPAEPIVAENTTAAQSIYCDDPGTFSLGGPIVLASGEVDMAAGFGCHLAFDGPMSGAADLRLATLAVASVTLNAVNTFTGITRVSGKVFLGVNDALAASIIVDVGGAGALDFQNHSQTMKYLTGGGDVLLGTATLTIDAPQNALTFHEAISGVGGIIKKGVGTWYLSGANTYTGPTLVQGGFLSVVGSIVSPVTLDGGTLQGKGTVAAVGGSSGTLEATHIGNPSKLTSGSIVLAPGITFHAIVDGPGAGTQYSQLAVNGSVDLGGATLDADINSNFLTANVGALILIDNDGADTVVGTFQGLAQDSILQSGGKAFRLSYVGGTGNDVTLTPTESTYYLSEGATGSFFDTEILIANPNGDAVPISIDYLKEDGTTIPQTFTLAESSRVTIRADDVVGLDSTAFSTVVKSLTGLPIVVERTMRWDATGYGSHTDKATGGAAYTWYFAEGSQGFFWTYLLLANPDASPNEARVTFLRENLPPLERIYELAPKSRSTLDLGLEAELMNTSFGIEVRFDRPATAERAMYFGASPLWKGGHESAGETVTSNNWFLAEGATGSFFETFILIANTHVEDVQATLTFLPASGVPVQKKKTVPARGRITVNVEAEDPSLSDAAVATQVTSFVSTLIVERAQYWPSTPDQWHEAHNSFGVTAPATRWGLAEGRAGGPENYQTYLLLANPGMVDTEATVTLLRESGAPHTEKIAVPAQTRINLSVGPGGDVPELANERFGAVITSDQPIVVERAMFWDANGQFWSAGTNATATRLP